MTDFGKRVTEACRACPFPQINDDIGCGHDVQMFAESASGEWSAKRLTLSILLNKIVNIQEMPDQGHDLGRRDELTRWGVIFPPGKLLAHRRRAGLLKN